MVPEIGIFFLFNLVCLDPRQQSKQGVGLFFILISLKSCNRIGRVDNWCNPLNHVPSHCLIIVLLRVHLSVQTGP